MVDAVSGRVGIDILEADSELSEVSVQTDHLKDATGAPDKVGNDVKDSLDNKVSIVRYPRLEKNNGHLLFDS